MNAVAYIRVSTEEQAREGVSLADQERRIQEYAQFKGLTVTQFFRDEGVSAKVPLNERPEGVKLLATIEPEEGPKTVLATKLDRMFRSALDCLSNIDNWQKQGVTFHLIDLGGNAVDVDTAMGKMFITMLAGFAEMERNLISERVTQGMAQVKAEGGAIGRPPYGWEYSGPDDLDKHGRQKLVKSRPEARTLQAIMSLHGQGMTLKAICATLTQAGYPTKRGGEWHPGTVSKMVKRELKREREARK